MTSFSHKFLDSKPHTNLNARIKELSVEFDPEFDPWVWSFHHVCLRRLLMLTSGEPSLRGENKQNQNQNQNQNQDLYLLRSYNKAFCKDKGNTHIHIQIQMVEAWCTTTEIAIKNKNKDKLNTTRIKGLKHQTVTSIQLGSIGTKLTRST